MRHPHTLDPSSAALVIVDMQTAFQPAIADFNAVAKRIAMVAKASALLGVPVLVTEQYSKGLGAT
ncbi:MAG: isochorismatase family protein, partial [Tepidisphaeraceae bacterium]